MRRRSLLQAAGASSVGLFAGLAGCGGSATVSNASRGDGSESVGGEQSTSTAEFVAAVERQDIDVDSTMEIAGDVSLFYWHDQDAHRRDIRVLADVFMAHRSIAEHLLSLTALNPDGSQRGGLRIQRDWADARASGSLSAATYHQRVLDTWHTI